MNGHWFKLFLHDLIILSLVIKSQPAQSKERKRLTENRCYIYIPMTSDCSSITQSPLHNKLKCHHSHFAIGQIHKNCITEAMPDLVMITMISAVTVSGNHHHEPLVLEWVLRDQMWRRGTRTWSAWRLAVHRDIHFPLFFHCRQRGFHDACYAVSTKYMFTT